MDGFARIKLEGRQRGSEGVGESQAATEKECYIEALSLLERYTSWRRFLVSIVAF